MILDIWVYFMLGDPTPTEPGIAYVQATASRLQHEYAPEATEQACAAEYAAKYPGHPVCECGWRRQAVRVTGG